MSTIKYDREKLRELALYIAEKMQGERYFGATILNKALFYCDFEWFRETGKPMTGATYQKLNYGPAPREILSVIKSLCNDGSAEIITRATYVGRQKRLVPKRRAKLDEHFKPEQIALVNEIISSLTDVTAGSISAFSHQHIGWRVAEYREDIPYVAVHLADQGALPSDVKRGLVLAKEHGWLKAVAAQ